jgi:ubiquinol-cytochrome c reductase cytochrome b subunit
MTSGRELREEAQRGGEGALRFIDERTGAAVLLRKTLRYVFPDHWSFMLGEVALYCFIVLVGTGTFLALFFDPSDATTTYSGPYALLAGQEVSRAYDSAMNLSFNVPGGLLLRQTHHWAADVFLVAITVHLLRIFFTGAFRKPREPNYLIGVTLLMVAVLEGFCGYSLLDDLLSGMGLAIGYGVVMSIPIVGGDVAHAIWAGEYPGGHELFSRLYIAHVFLLPAVIALLITLHLLLIVRARHTQFPGPLRTARNVIGTPTWPGYALRSLGVLALTAAVLFALGGLVQINPIWQWGPYEPYLGSNGAQPDWYLGWLIGALRIMPPVEIVVWGKTLVPNPFFGGAGFPLAVFGFLYAWPWIEQRFLAPRWRRDGAAADPEPGEASPAYDLLDRPRDNPQRTAIGAAVFTWVATVFVGGSADRIFLATEIPYDTQVWIFRGAFFVFPAIAYVVAKRWAGALRAGELHPLRGWQGTRLVRTPEGGWAPAEGDGPGGPAPRTVRGAPGASDEE